MANRSGQGAHVPDEEDVWARNQQFWSDLFGSQAAETLGIADESPQSPAKFDAWCFDSYQYLALPGQRG